MRLRDFWRFCAFLAFIVLWNAGPSPAQMVDPAIDKAGEPFSYFSQPTDELGVMYGHEGTLVTPEGYLYTGFGELMFFNGNPAVPVAQRVKTLRDGYLPIIEYSFESQGFTYSFTMFAITLDSTPDSTLVNFVRVRIRNATQKTATRFFSVGLRYQDNTNTGRIVGDSRYARHGKGKLPPTAVEFNPQWTYGFQADAFLRDGKIMYLFPQDAHAERMLTLQTSGNSIPDIAERPLQVLPTTPTGIVQYRLMLAPHQERVLDFCMPYEPIAKDDSKAAALRSAIFDQALARTKKFWNDILTRGIEISVPEEKPADAFKANLFYDLMALDKQGDAYVQTVNEFQYHNFWIRDSAYILRMYDVSGYPEYAREVLDHFAGFQKPDGNFVSQEGQFDGFGQALWAYGEHYRITKDQVFAEKAYPSVQKAVEWLKAARRSDPMHLIPASTPGDNEDITGHVTGHNFWALGGLQSAIIVAQALGKDADAQDFRHEYDDYKAALLRRLSQITSQSGGYIPPGLDKLGGQDWGNLQSVYPETVLEPFDPRVTATLKMAQAKYQEGLMTYGDGRWLHHYLTPMNTETELIRGEQQRVIEEFYALLVHTSSTHAGFEFEILPWKTRDFDGNLSPHGTFAASFRLLMRDMFVREQGSDLHVLSAISPEWVQQGKSIVVRRAPSNCGEVNYTVKFLHEAARIAFANHFTSAPSQIVLHIPWFMKASSVVVDGAKLQVQNGMVRLPANVQGVKIQWTKLTSAEHVSFNAEVNDYKAEYRRHYDKFLATGDSGAITP